MMDSVYTQNSLNTFETLMLSENYSEARNELKKFLFCFTSHAGKGSLAEAVELLATSHQREQGAAAVLLRAIGSGNFLPHNDTNHIVRHCVTLVENALPDLTNFFQIKSKRQNFEKYEVLLGIKSWVEDTLSPLNIQYQTLETLLLARKNVVGALSHKKLIEFCKVYHIHEISESINSIFNCLEKVSKINNSLSEDIEACEHTISSSKKIFEDYPSFITINFFKPFLNCCSKILNSFIISLHGRFNSIIKPEWTGSELPKRYPLLEAGRDLSILLPFDNEGPGTATDVKITISSESQTILFLNENIDLGNISPGRFSVAIDVSVIDQSDDVSMIIDIDWGQVGTTKRQSSILEVNVLAQASGVMWEKYTYSDPYGTGPAEGHDFVGRKEQIQTLVARMLRRQMEPAYITGQKRVGKTSLATAAVSEAQTRDPSGKLTWHYILWGQIAHEDPRICLQQLGEQIEEFIIECFPSSSKLPKGNYNGSLSPLIKLSTAVKSIDPECRFVIIIDEFDEMPQELYLQGNLAETVFGNIRALTATSNISLLLVGGENMPFVMDRQGQKLNKFSRVNLTYFDRSTEREDYARLIREPAADFLNWHDDAIAEVYDLTNGNPYFSKIICSKVYARALREHDIDVTREEVKEVVNSEISRLDENLFAHLWQDGIFAPVDEREPIVLKRKRILAAFARCSRSGLSTTADNIYLKKNSSDLSESEMKRILSDFVSREVLSEMEGLYKAVLPIFQLWMVDIGLTRLAADSLSQDLSYNVQYLEDEARVLSEELVSLTRRWPTYRGRHIGSDDVRAWLNQRPSCRDQRALFTILKATRFLSEEVILERIRGARLTALGLAEATVRKSAADRRNDIVITYVDGEGKSGQKYASLYAEENFIASTAILPPSNFLSAYQNHGELYGKPKNIVIIDDIVGTGRSFSDNLKSFHDRNIDILNLDKPVILTFVLLSTLSGQAKVLRALLEIHG